MKVIHLFWSPELNAYENTGSFNLWIETSEKTNKRTIHPFQTTEKQLIELCKEKKWLPEYYKRYKNLFSTKKVLFPCDKQGKVLLSPKIANIVDLDTAEYAQHNEQCLITFQLLEPFTFLKEISFQQFSFDDDLSLGEDTKFWINFMRTFSAMVKKDNYIPIVFAHKEENKKIYTNKWEVISSTFDAELKNLTAIMPSIACLGEFSAYDFESALHHVSDVMINTLVEQTVFSQKNEKGVENTLLDGCLRGYSNKKSYLDPDLLSHWINWRTQLQHEQFGADFTLCFRLIAASDAKSNDWGILLQLQSKQDPSFFVDLQDFWYGKDSKSEHFSKYFGEGIERQLLLQLGYACKIYPKLETIFNNNSFNSFLSISEQDALEFLQESAWQLQGHGYRIIVPTWWTQKGRNKLKIKLNASASSEKTDNPISYFGKDGLIRFDYQIAMGNTEVSKEEWQLLMNAKTELVFFRGEWVEINKEEMAKLKILVDHENLHSQTGSLQSLLQKISDDDRFITQFDDHINTIVTNLNQQNDISLIESPKNLKATLRPYQQRGLSWLAYLEQIGMNPCLADDMGLGKTMQIIALLLARPLKEPALLIAPTSVIGNWFKELQKFAPSIKALVHHGQIRAKNEDFAKEIQDKDIVITSYGLIRRDKALFDKTQWSRIIIDEAQNIKNPTAAQTKAIFSLKAQSRIALTGTPIENRLMDIWSIFNYLNPGLLNTKTAFRKEFELPVQRDKDLHKTRMLKNLVTPFILRRLKTDKNIISDLPDKIEQKVYTELTLEQASLYQLIVNEIKGELNSQESIPDKKMIMLSALLRLKQCCNHPAQYLQDGSDFTPERSNKLQRLLETVNEAIDNNESILIFSQFTDICEKLQRLLKNQLGFTTHYLHGGTSRKQRDIMIDAFQAKDSPASVFILSLKAGGVGITLTRANHVIHFDRWWNPAVENQATDRAYRIGQQKTVFAHKFITLGTVEEKIDTMLEDKQSLADGIISNDESWLTELSTDAFIKMIELNQGAA